MPTPPPRVCRGESCGQTADLYSLGMVLYDYLNENCLPFLPPGAATERDREEARRRRLAGEAVPPPATAVRCCNARC